MFNKVKRHFKENVKSYFILFAILLLGLIVGIAFINHANNAQKEQISNYISGFTTTIKDSKIDYWVLLKNSIMSNIKITLIIIFVSMSLFGTIGSYIIPFYKGFSLGYTISSIIAVFGVAKGLTFAMSLILLNQLVYIPAMIYLIICSNKFYRKIINDELNDTKLEIIRYIITVSITVILFLLSSLIETFISSNLLLALLGFITSWLVSSKNLQIFNIKIDILLYFFKIIWYNL